MIKYIVYIFILYTISVKCTRPFNIHDLHGLQQVGAGDIFVPKNGSEEYVWSEKHWDEATDITKGHIKVLKNGQEYYVGNNGGDGVVDFSPFFAHDGSVFFLRNQHQADNAVSVNLYHVETDYESGTSGSDTPMQITSLPTNIGNVKIARSTDSSITTNVFNLFFSADIYFDCADKILPLQCTADRDAAKAKIKTHGKIYDSLFMRHWASWSTGKHSHLFRLAICNPASTNEWKTCGNPVDLMKDLTFQSPVPPFGGAELYDVSADGSQIAYTAEKVQHSMSWRTDWKVFVQQVGQGNNIGTPMDITNYTNARTQTPRFSPDGSKVAFLAMAVPGFEADRLRIQIYDMNTKRVSGFSSNWDRTVVDLEWISDGNGFFATAEDDGNVKLFVVRANENVNPMSLQEHNAIVKTVSKDGVDTLILMRNSANAPNEMWSFDYSRHSSFTGKQITFANTKTLAQFKFGKRESLHYSGAENHTIQGWFYYPYGFDASNAQDIPMVMISHGGPQGAFGDSWSNRWLPQLWAQHGYAVFTPNFHGSIGWGQNFTDSVSNNWGKYSYQDIIKGTQYVINKYDWIDGDNVHANGASYGGYMMNWINAMDDHVFKSLVCHDGVFDTMAMGYATEELWFPRHEYGGTKQLPPWVDDSGYEKYNPRRFVDSMNTPMLVIHSAQDFRIPLSQGIMAFNALQQRDVKSKFLYFENENHWIDQSHYDGIFWYDTVLDWIDDNAGLNN